MAAEVRPTPESLLGAANAAEAARGKLRVFLGMSAGVGKTYAMLEAAHARAREGHDVVVGFVETHGRRETEALLAGLPVIPRKRMPYRGVTVEEFDLDACLARRPALVLVDELAHTNAGEALHRKRHQDVAELLDHGIDVYTTLNVQHLESRKDLVERIAGIRVHETVPDAVLEAADQVDLVDLSPADLLRRLAEGKVYLGDRARAAREGFFQPAVLTALREIALRVTAEKVDHDLQSFPMAKADAWSTNERLLVAVSHSPHSERLIRATRRIAYNLDAPWVAAHVDTGSALSVADAEQLERNLRLARELGAEVASIRAEDVVEALRALCVRHNVTQVVVGRSPRRTLVERWWGGSLIERVLERSRGIDVHVIRQETASAPRRWNFIAASLRRNFFSYWNTLWVMAAIIVAGAALEPWIGYRAIGFIFLLGVLGVGFLGSAGPVLFAAGVSAVAWNVLFIPPRFTLVIGEAADLMMCLAYFLTAATVGLLTHKARRHERLIRAQEEQARALYEVLGDIAAFPERADFVAKVLSRLAGVLPGSFGVRLKDQAAVFGFVPATDKEEAVARWVMDRGAAAGWSTETLSQVAALYLPLIAKRGVIGVLAFQPEEAVKLTVAQQTLLSSIVGLLTQALERYDDREKLREAEQAKNSEHLHETLLSSVSHEIRTPLTAIMGAAAALADPAAAANAAELSAELLRSSRRLNQVVENLLDMTRLSAGKLTLRREWHDLSDLVGVVLRRLDRTAPETTVVIPDGFPLLQIDYRFFEHVLSNLLLNAATHAPDSAVTVRAVLEGARARIVVEDDGPGIPAASLPFVFDKFYRVPGSRSGGTGLGLSIVKSIVELHGGTIAAENRAEGGTRFILVLPAGDPPSAPRPAGGTPE